MKGGYKIIDFKNAPLSGTPVTMTDVLVDLLNNYEKVVLLSHVVLSGSAKDDCFSTVLSDGEGGVKLNCYDGYISINSSGAVTYTVASASGMAGDIVNLQGDLADTNNMIASAWSATETYTKNTIVRDGRQLYKAKSDVPTGTATSNTTYWKSITTASELKETADNDATQSFVLTSDKCTIDSPNSYSRQNGNVINAFADIVFTENVNAWTKFLNFGFRLTNNMPVMVSIYNYDSTSSHNRRGVAFTNGDLSVGYDFANEVHYLIGITLIK